MLCRKSKLKGLSTSRSKTHNLATSYKRKLTRNNPGLDEITIKTSKKKRINKEYSTTAISSYGGEFKQKKTKYKIVSMPLLFLHRKTQSKSSLFSLKCYEDVQISKLSLNIFEDKSCNDSDRIFFI